MRVHLSSMDHRDRDRHRDRNQRLELAKRDLDQGGSIEQELKLRNLLYGICQFTQVIDLWSIDLSRVLDVFCAEAQMQELGVQADAKIGYAGNVAIQCGVINAVCVNDLRLTITTNVPGHVQLERFQKAIQRVDMDHGDWLEMETLETTVLTAQSATGIGLAPGHSRELPVSRGNAHLRQPVIRGNALLDGGQTR